MIECKLKKTTYKSLNADKEINKYFSKKYVGGCMSLLREYRNSVDEPDYLEWLNFYLNKIGSDKLKVVKDVIINKGYDADTAKYYVIFRTVSQTWNGMISETKVKKIIENSFNIDVTYADDRTDSYYCVDLETNLFGIQVKPESYRVGNNPSLNRDKGIHLKSHKLYEQETGRKVFFAYYNGDTIDESFKHQINIYLELKNNGKQ